MLARHAGFGWLFAGNSLRIWQLYAVAALAGTGGMLEAVAAQSFIPALVPRDALLPANSALMLSTATVGTVGSGLGARGAAGLDAHRARRDRGGRGVVRCFCPVQGADRRGCRCHAGRH